MMRNAIVVLTAAAVVAIAGCEQSARSTPRVSSPGEQAPIASAPQSGEAENQTSGHFEAAQAGELAGATATEHGTASGNRQAPGSVRVVAFYFHRTLRCPTCLAIEEQAAKAIHAGYAQELKDGVVEWRPVNIEDPGNKHFERDFELTTSSLVLVQMRGSDVIKWKLLGKVWDLVDDGPKFQKYVQTELAGFVD